MLELFFIVLSFAVGRWMGIDQANNQVHEERDKFKSLWLDAEDKAETWKRRYNNLLPTTQTSFEE
jgi:hypothetical protein